MQRDFTYGPHNPLIDEVLLTEFICKLFNFEISEKEVFWKLYKESLDATSAGINPAEAINKVRRSENMCKLLLDTKEVPGSVVECGVFKGSTAYLLAHIMENAGINKVKNLYLYDSFEGLPASSREDYIVGVDGEFSLKFDEHRFANVNYENIVRIFEGKKWVKIVKGWIPQVFPKNDEKYSFVHIDVDLYQSTLDCLEYYVPRMSSGGIVVCDDYGSLTFPGARKAWDDYITKHGLKFIPLDNQQCMLKKQ